MENGEGFNPNSTVSGNKDNLNLKNIPKIRIIENISKSTGYTAEIIATKGFFDKKVGSALLTSFDVDQNGDVQSAHLNVVQTVEKYRGKGIGRAVVEAAIDHARKRGIKTIELDSVEDAVGFYKKLGFEEVENGNGRMRMDLTSELDNQKL